jgi:hypothetical protein
MFELSERHAGSIIKLVNGWRLLVCVCRYGQAASDILKFGIKSAVACKSPHSTCLHVSRPQQRPISRLSLRALMLVRHLLKTSSLPSRLWNVSNLAGNLLT